MNFKPELLKKDENKEFRWKGKMWFKGLFDGEHYFKLTTDENGHTKLIHGENFSGILSGLILRFIGSDTHQGFEKMNEALGTARDEVGEYAPRIETITIPTDKIRDVIGTGGKVIREIVEVTGAKVDVNDDGAGGPIVPGVGLTSLQRRAENLGGRLSIGSNQPTGVHLHLELPTGAVA